MTELQNFPLQVKNSFFAASKGQENVKNVIYWWGLLSYVIFYFVVNKLILKVDNKAFDVLLSLIAIFYFIWHIYATKKCEPKKIKIPKEQNIEVNKTGNFSKTFLKKLLLQEPISKWNPVLMTIVMDLIFICHFLGYIF